MGLLKQSSAYYGPGSSVVQMVEAVLRNSRRVLPVSVKLEGEYGLRDVCIGVPVELGRQGMARVIEQPLKPGELQALHTAAKQVREAIDHLQKTPLAATSPPR